MAHSGFFRTPDIGRHILMCLLAIAMALRALIPAGYMPDANALRDGRVEITFCIAGSGLSVSAIDLNDHDGKAGHPDSVASECPFGILAQQAFDLPPVAGAVMPAAALAVLSIPFTLNRALPALPAQGPPLGSRAPPSNLG
jgi:hypothetical protein